MSGVVITAKRTLRSFTRTWVWDERCGPSHTTHKITYLSNSALAASSMVWHTCSGVEVPA